MFEFEFIFNGEMKYFLINAVWYRNYYFYVFIFVKTVVALFSALMEEEQDYKLLVTRCCPKAFSD